MTEYMKSVVGRNQLRDRFGRTRSEFCDKTYCFGVNFISCFQGFVAGGLEWWLHFFPNAVAKDDPVMGKTQSYASREVVEASG
jgi:hypothetical protein